MGVVVVGCCCWLLLFSLLSLSLVRASFSLSSLLSSSPQFAPLLVNLLTRLCLWGGRCLVGHILKRDFQRVLSRPAAQSSENIKQAEGSDAWCSVQGTR